MRMAWVGWGAIVVATIACKGGPTSTAPVETKAEPEPAAALAGIDGVACVGAIGAAPAGAVVEEDRAVREPLLALALAASEKGNLCAGQVYRATAPITVHRVWNSEKEFTRIGRWWSFAAPTGTREAYRRDNVICEDWSRLDRAVTCEIAVGARFVVGPGQSVACDVGASYPKSATNQVFIANDGQKNEIFVERCGEPTAWP